MSQLFAALVLFCALARAADPKQPHPHQGTLEPFKLGPPPALSSAELAGLTAGKPVQKTIQLPDGTGARALAVFDVGAPPELVWACINDLKQYPRMVPGVKEMELYDKAALGGGGTATKAKWTLAMLGYKMSYWLELRYEPKHNCMTFRLDYSRLSDIDDTVGYWHVAKRSGPSGEAFSRVTYSAALTLRGWFPKAVIDVLLSTTLGRATQWVSTEANLRLAKSGGGAAAGSSSETPRKKCRWTWKGRKCVSPPPPPAPPPAGPNVNGLLGVVGALAVGAVLGRMLFFR